MSSEKLLAGDGENEPVARSSSSYMNWSSEQTGIFEELPKARIISVSKPDASDFSPLLLSYTIQLHYKQFTWHLTKKASQVIYLHFALKKRAIVEEFHEKQEQVKEWLQNMGIAEQTAVVHDDDEPEDGAIPVCSEDNAKSRYVPSRAALPIIRPSLGRQQTIAEKAKVAMQGYLNHFLGNMEIVNSREVCKFLEVSKLSFLQEYGPKLKEDYVMVKHLQKISRTNAETSGCLCCWSCCNNKWQKVCVMVKLNPKTNVTAEGTSVEFLRLRMLRCHKELKLNQPLTKFSCDSWKKTWHLLCEFGTKGLVLELRNPKGRCFKGSSLVDAITFSWNALLRAPSLTLVRETNEKLRLFASMTPPVQAPYLLKCVADRVTDDSGAMISDVILKMNQYRPQEGRWLSRTVLDHAGRECFVIRMRVAGGIWRRGGEVPSAVKWEDRIIEIREGSWFYEAGSIGRAPSKVVGSAIPKEPPEGWQASWCFSTGDELLVKYGSSASISGLGLYLKTPVPTDSWLRLLIGRQLQYQEQTSRDINASKEYNERNREQHVDEDDGFVTLVRYSEENPDGKATGLINWKLLLVELHPEEDTAFMLLLCISLLRSITEIKKEDIGGLLIRRRLKEAMLGARDWGSVVLHPFSCSSSISSPYVHPWHWNPKVLMAMDKVDMTMPIGVRHPPEEGGDKLYKLAIIA